MSMSVSQIMVTVNILVPIWRDHSSVLVIRVIAYHLMVEIAVVSEYDTESNKLKLVTVFMYT